MKQRAIRFLCLGMTSILLLTGCNPLSKDDSEQDEEAAANRVTWEEHMEEWKTKAPNEIEDMILAYASKDYRITADVYIPDELESYEVQNVRISRHIHENPDEVIKETAEYFGLEWPSEEKVRELEDSTYENGVRLQYAAKVIGEDGSTFVALNGSSVMVSTPFLRDYSSWGLLSWGERMQISKVHSETMMQKAEEELLSEAEITEIKEKLESIFGVTFLDNYMLETCTLERLQELVDYEKTFSQKHGVELDENGRWEVTEADEGTVLWLQQGYDGIPLLFDEPEYSVTGARYPVASYCNVLSSKDGVEALEMSGLYDIHEPVETVQILSFGEFIEKHMELCSGLQTNVARIGLYYLPYYTGEGLDFIAKPVWYVQTEKIGETGYPERQAIIYDAVTGEEIPWY